MKFLLQSSARISCYRVVLRLWSSYCIAGMVGLYQQLHSVIPMPFIFFPSQGARRRVQHLS